MHQLKISVITVCCNAGATISRCIQSVISQDYPNVEYIIIDGASADDTVLIAKAYTTGISQILSEPDRGIYDAMNKGITLATGDVIGMLNADDFYADNNVLSAVAQAFEQSNADVVYGDLDYIKPDGNVLRKWRSGRYKNGMFNLGWMPPHPAFYCKKSVYSACGTYSLEYGTAADYELMLRLIHVEKVSVFYLRRIMVKMRTGGVSNSSFINRIKSMSYDWRAMRNNNILFPTMSLIMKLLLKIRQYF